MCEYMGYEFGGGYIDSVCIDGQLFDCDNCDDEGGLYEPMEFVPCPMCSPKEAVDYWITRLGNDGRASCRVVRKKARALVSDIRRNRGVLTFANPAPPAEDVKP